MNSESKISKWMNNQSTKCISKWTYEQANTAYMVGTVAKMPQ
jgi:hypothetical protein